MKPAHLIHSLLIGGLASAVLIGCSIRSIPLDRPFDEEPSPYEREAAVYEGYYSGSGSPPPDFSDEAWQMFQYYRYANEPYYGDYTPEFGGVPQNGLNVVDVNPNNRYRVDEEPVQRAPSQYSGQTTDNRRAGQRDEAFRRTVNRNRQETVSSDERRNNRDETRQRLRASRHRSDTTTATDEDREAERQKTRRRTQR